MAESRRALAVDADDVLFQTAPSNIEWFNQKYGLSLGLDDMFQRPTAERYGTDDIQVLLGRVTAFTLERGLDLPVMEGASDVLSRFRKAGFTWHIITGRSALTRVVTEQSIAENYPGLISGVHFTDTLSPGGHQAKLSVCREIGAVAMIDDQRLVDSAEGLPVKQVLFGDYPWNATNRLAPGVAFCRSWPEVEAEIERIAKQ